MTSSSRWKSFSSTLKNPMSRHFIRASHFDWTGSKQTRDCFLLSFTWIVHKSLALDWHWLVELPVSTICAFLFEYSFAIALISLGEMKWKWKCTEIVIRLTSVASSAFQIKFSRHSMCCCCCCRGCCCCVAIWLLLWCVLVFIIFSTRRELHSKTTLSAHTRPESWSKSKNIRFFVVYK